MIIAKKRINSVDFIEEFESKEFLIGIVGIYQTEIYNDNFYKITHKQNKYP